MNPTLEHFDATWEPVLQACKDALIGSKIGIMSLSSCMFSLRWLRFGKKREARSLRRRESDTSSRGFVLPKSAKHTPFAPAQAWTCSPDGAQRHPGAVSQPARSFPDFAGAQSGLQAIASSQKKIGPCFGSGPGDRPRSSLLPSPQARGSARRQGAAWIAPGWNGLGVKRHAPRLAAHQRGIFAFRRLTVVGPGRLLVAGEAARVRPGDEGCVSFARRCRSRSPPTRRLMNAPLVEWIGIGGA